MEVIIVGRFSVVIVLFSITSLGWFFDVEISSSTSISTDWVVIKINYKYMEIGRERQGILNVSIENISKRFLILEDIESNASLVTVPSSNLAYPLKIPPLSLVSLSSITSPKKLTFIFDFDRGRLKASINAKKIYDIRKNSILKEHLAMFMNFLIGVFILLMIREMVRK